MPNKIAIPAGDKQANSQLNRIQAMPENSATSDLAHLLHPCDEHVLLERERILLWIVVE